MKICISPHFAATKKTKEKKMTVMRKLSQMVHTKCRVCGKEVEIGLIELSRLHHPVTCEECLKSGKSAADWRKGEVKRVEWP